MLLAEGNEYCCIFHPCLPESKQKKTAWKSKQKRFIPGRARWIESLLHR
jgi:hypothetical protein